MIGVIVDGPGDFAAIRSRFLGQVQVMKTEGPRGHTVSSTDLIRSCRKQVAMLAGLGCTKVLMVTDFEERSDDYAKFSQTLNEGLSQLQAPIQVTCCLAHRMIENWFLADIEEISEKRKYIRNHLRQKQYEGTHGKKELKALFEKGYYYSEVQHGQELMTTIRLEVARSNSASLCFFLDTLVGE